MSIVSSLHIFISCKYCFLCRKFIIPSLELAAFEKMIEQLETVLCTLNPKQVRKLWEFSMQVTQAMSSEKE